MLSTESNEEIDHLRVFITIFGSGEILELSLMLASPSSCTGIQLPENLLFFLINVHILSIQSLIPADLGSISLA